MQRKRAEDAAAGRSAVETAMAQLVHDAVQHLPLRHLQGLQRARRHPDRRHPVQRYSDPQHPDRQHPDRQHPDRAAAQTPPPAQQGAASDPQPRSHRAGS